MDAQDFRSLQEAYMEVVMNEGLGGFKKQDDYEERVNKFNRDIDANLERFRSASQKRKKASQAQEFLKKHPRKKGTQKEQVDIYDIILSHLLDEGYAETPEAAEVIMVNMSEDWRESICEELTGERRKRELEKGTPLANRVATGREGQPVERRNRSGDIIMRTTTKAPTKRGGGGEKGERKADWSGWEADRGSGNKAARRAGKKVRDTSDEL
jgi:hypothetical protein